jgi:hypothetical protein
MGSTTLPKITEGRWLVKVKATSQPVLVLALAAALTASAALAQQSQPKAPEHLGSGQSGMMSANMGDPCKQMMAMRTQMMAAMNAMDASLNQKVAAMNAAKGSEKIDAMAVVINEMATQRKQMMAKTSSMRDQMMAHMSEHMAQPGSAGMGQSMVECPMMKGMSDMGEQPADTHKEHHEQQK